MINRWIAGVKNPIFRHKYWDHHAIYHSKKTTLWWFHIATENYHSESVHHVEFGNFPLSHDITITIHPYIYINGNIKSLTLIHHDYRWSSCHPHWTSGCRCSAIARHGDETPRGLPSLWLGDGNGTKRWPHWAREPGALRLANPTGFMIGIYLIISIWLDGIYIYIGIW
jgi:hypothetical protein